MRAVLLARATAASLGFLRLTSPSSQAAGLPLPRCTCWTTDMAPQTRRRRRSSSPARVITPSRVLPAVEWSLGVRPSQAAKWRAERKVAGSGAFMTSMAAVIGPTPGIWAKRRLASFWRCQAISRASSLAMRRSSSAYSWPYEVKMSFALPGHPRVARDPSKQCLELAKPLARHQPELRRIAANGVAPLRAPAPHLLAHPCQHQRRLLRLCLHRHETHRRPAHRLADRLGVDLVVLAPLDVGLHILRRQQHHLMTQGPQLPGPVVGPTAGLYPHLRWRETGKEVEHLAPTQLPAQHHLLALIHSMQLKNTLGRVHTNANNLFHGRLPWLRS